MASLNPTFELNFSGTASTATKDDWYDIGVFANPSLSPVPSGKQVFLGLALMASLDKTITCEMRVNTSGQNTATAGTTYLLGSCTLNSGDSYMFDYYMNGLINTLMPTTLSTGVEKIWLRVTSGTNTVGSFNFFLWYTMQGA